MVSREADGEDGKSPDQARLMPSQFMRRLRPECYSDSERHTSIQLDRAVFEHRLDSITVRNETHGFEIFCRKLCERTICPNLLPATGPEGGGDSKADTETVPIADEISVLWYIGSVNAGSERWAFAFSAQKRWTRKVRDDIAGLIATGRGYRRIYCVTSRPARARDRARLEEVLSRKYGIDVRVLDRSWIVNEVIDQDRRELAYLYLGAGQEVQSARVGPTDYSRAQQLDEVEKAISDPASFAGMEGQLVTEALVAASLSRNLERPRIETDGRFARAIRLADRHGGYRQRLAAHYESLWSAFWWFDEIDHVNASYDAFERLALETDDASNVELLCNVLQLLFNAVVHQHLTPEEAKLTERVATLTAALKLMAEDDHRPNNALEARTSSLIVALNEAHLAGDHATASALWTQLRQILQDARGLGEFDARRLIRLIEAVGPFGAKDPEYGQLVEDLAEFVAERTSAGESALILLKRAKQLGVEEPAEMIRLLGKAAVRLAKKEYSDALIEASQLLAIAYRSVGLLWAARATAIFALAQAFIGADQPEDLPPSVLGTLTALEWIVLELGHVPDALQFLDLVRGCFARLPLNEASKQRVVTDIQQFDRVLSIYIVRLSPQALERVTRLPEVLDRLELNTSRAALLYVLGHESVLREEGTISPSDTAESVAELFAGVSVLPGATRLMRPPIFNETGTQRYATSVLGMHVEVEHPGTESGILTAEAIIGSIEAFFATTLQMRAAAHTEHFRVVIEEDARASAPTHSIDLARMIATICWPAGLLPADFGARNEVRRTIIVLTGQIFSATCYVPEMQKTLERLLRDEAVLDRIALIVAVGNSRHRLSRKHLSRLSDWSEGRREYPIQPTRPVIAAKEIGQEKKSVREGPAVEQSTDPPAASDHRDVTVRSVIDVHTWDRARWRGVGFITAGDAQPPLLALLFENREAAEQIFCRWHDRFGSEDKDEEIFVAAVRGISAANPTHYRLLIASRPPDEWDEGQFLMTAARIHTLEPESDINLTEFLQALGRTKAYYLVPAVFRVGDAPEFLLEHAILKRALSAKFAHEIGSMDIEMLATKQR